MNEPTPQTNSPRISTLKAVLIGQLVVNFPLFLIVLVLFILVGAFLPDDSWVALVGAVLLGYLWWSFSTRKWREWAISKGVPPRDLTRMAAFTGLARPRDWYMYDMFTKDEEKDERNRR